MLFIFIAAIIVVIVMLLLHSHNIKNEQCQSDCDNANEYNEPSSDSEVLTRTKYYAESSPEYIRWMCDNYERCFISFKYTTLSDYFHDMSYAFSVLLALQERYDNIHDYCRIDPYEEYRTLSLSIDHYTNDFLIELFEKEKTILDNLKTPKGKRNNFEKFIQSSEEAFKEASKPFESEKFPQYTGILYTENNIETFNHLKEELQKELPLLPEEAAMVSKYIRYRFDIDTSDSARQEHDEVRLSFEPYVSIAINSILISCPQENDINSISEIDNYIEFIRRYSISADDITHIRSYLMSKYEENIAVSNVLAGMELEKSKDPDDLKEAILKYEANVEKRYPNGASYERLMVIYRRNKDYVNEQRVINVAISVFNNELTKLLQQLDETNTRIVGMKETLEKWTNRLEKSRKLQMKETAIQTD